MKFVYGVLAVVLTLGGVSPALAQQAGVRLQPPADPLYFGLMAGSMDADGTEDAASNVGVMVGYKFHEDERGAFFGEGQYTRTFSEGDVANPPGEWDVETLSAFGGFRSAGPWFWKAKLGLTFWDLAVDPTSPAEDDDTSVSFGIGGGARLNDNTGVEVEYTLLDSDIEFLSVGVFTRF